MATTQPQQSRPIRRQLQLLTEILVWLKSPAHYLVTLTVTLTGDTRLSWMMVTAVLDRGLDCVVTGTMGSTPLDLLRGGPAQFRKRMLGHASVFERTDRKSAVEQLEESKVQYVKSEQVLDHRQLPNNTDTLHVGWCRCKSRPTTETDQPCSSAEGHCVRRRGEFLPPDSEATGGVEWERCMQNEHGETHCATHSMQCGDAAVMEQIAQRSDKPRLHLTRDQGTDSGSDAGGMGSSSQLQQLEDSNAPVVIVRRHRKGVSRSRSDVIKRHSSSSDISARFSRNSADLERFFNSMGLEQSILEPMLSVPTARAPSASTLNLFDCSSSLTSANPRSIYSDDSYTDPVASRACFDNVHKSAGQTSSIVERNARIIKWLCGVKKAQPQHDASLTQ